MIWCFRQTFTIYCEWSVGLVGAFEHTFLAWMFQSMSLVSDLWCRGSETTTHTQNLRNNERVQYTHRWQIIDFGCFWFKRERERARKRRTIFVKSNALIVAFSQFFFVGAGMEMFVWTIDINDSSHLFFSVFFLYKSIYLEEDHCLQSQ